MQWHFSIERAEQAHCHWSFIRKLPNVLASVKSPTVLCGVLCSSAKWPRGRRLQQNNVRKDGFSELREHVDEFGSCSLDNGRCQTLIFLPIAPDPIGLTTKLE